MKHKPPISNADIQQLSEYFKANMTGPLNAVFLQEIISSTLYSTWVTEDMKISDQ